jgi:hypothetical protein
MPKKEVDYSKTLMYKIVCKDLSVTDLYVGSTTNFSKRKYCHKCGVNNERSQHYKIYVSIRNNGGWENWDMIEIEKYPCNDGNEGRARERYWTEYLNSQLNMRKPLRTEEDKTEYNKLYNASDKGKENTKRFRCSEKGKEYKKQYRETHKEYIKENYKDWNIVIECPCGGHYSKSHKTTHLVTKKHKNYLESLTV